MIITVTELPSY